MKSLLLALLAIVAMCVAVSSAEAHGGGVFVRDAFGNTVFVPNQGVIISRGFGGPVVVQRGPVVVRGHVNQFNQNGGRNRIGFRR